MQVLLSEQEYNKMKNDLNFHRNGSKNSLKDLRELIHNFQRAFQVTAKGYEKNKVEVVDIKLDVSKLIEIIIKNCFDERERKAINNYIDNGNRVKLSNVKMNEFDKDIFLNNIIDRIGKV
ncbi:hypothetical protein [Clostridium beijerinckii]|uniref:hypothetical protein n=1 Tax=Clostridium beijerinckii TaxID=1520 RepID=UPI00149459B4|nr:hypothetical protein [Clostridium beijerinckii]NOW03221.1 RNA-binding protein YhbY [Clostridium beijerinckii]NYC03637.1 RNA-binding protein YhbY [Clostridium beijerinckii]